MFSTQSQERCPNEQINLIQNKNTFPLHLLMIYFIYLLNFILFYLLNIYFIFLFIEFYLRNKSWKPECVLNFNMGWRILVFYPELETRDKIY